jgi:hypothetical protein
LNARSQTCTEGRPPAAQIGIGVYQCVGGDCSLFGRDSTHLAHQFSSEPILWFVDSLGPSGRQLHDADVLVAIDRALITTAEAGRRLANLRAGVQVELRIRRDEQEMTVRIEPRISCNYPTIVVSPVAGRPRPDDVPAWIRKRPDHM